MRPFVLDTNILLDIFVFDDQRASNLKQALFKREFLALASPKTIEELTDVIARPLFELNDAQQVQILGQWRSLVRLVSDADLAPAPWICEDTDDQIFLNLAYTLRPAIIISKDNALLKLANRAASEGILITADYQTLMPPN